MHSESLRIALISEHASPLAALGGVDAGGQNVYVAQVAHGLAERGHHVDVLTRRDDPGLPTAVLAEPRVTVMHIEAGPAAPVPKEQLLPYMPAFTRTLQRWMAHGPGHDIVHANFFMSGLAGLGCRQRLGIPLVTTFHALGLVRREHQGEQDGFPPARIAIESRLAHQSDRVIAECPQDKEDLLRLYDAEPSRIAVVPCGVDTGRFRPMPKAEARALLGLAPDEFVVLQLGRLVPRKGVDNVVQAVARLPAVIKPRLVIVGGSTREPDERATPEIARLRSLAQAGGIADRVRFEGCRRGDELRAYYAAADVFVSTPWYEPFGITPLEAMACATPVIGAEVGGIQHTVVDGVTGFLVPAKDPVVLAHRLERLVRHPLLAQAFGVAGMRRVRTHFTWRHVVDELLAVYLEVCAQRRQPAARRPLRLLHAVGRVPMAAGGGVPR